MKDGFKGFYTPDSNALRDIWSSHETIFVFDTNVYLNIYSYAEKTKEDLFSIFNVIKDNIWVPNHVALEYQMSRLGVMDRERENFTKITNAFNKFNNSINGDIIQGLGMEKKLPELCGSLRCFLAEFNKLCDSFISGVFEEQRGLKPDVRSGDEIRRKLDSILSGKIGGPFTQEELDAIYSEGDFRFSNKIPPGFRDAVKGDLSDYSYLNVNYKKKFGDLIIWKQIIRHASKEEIKNVILITDDKKNDWWYGVGDKIIGPHEKLQSEFYVHTNVDNFKMYDTVDFLKDAVEYLGTKIDEESLDDVKKARALFSVDLSSVGVLDGIEHDALDFKNNDVDGDKSRESEGYRDREEAMRSAVGLDRYRDREEAMRSAVGLGLDRYRDREEAMRSAFGLDRYRDQEDAMRSAVGLGRYRDREEAMRSAVGLDRYRDQEDAMERIGKNENDENEDKTD